MCSDAGLRTESSPDVIQALQTVKQLLLKAKKRQLELEKSEAQLTKSAKQVRTVCIQSASTSALAACLTETVCHHLSDCSLLVHHAKTFCLVSYR